jgi:uncharacterized protein YbbK (DUF523 family)
MAAGMPAPRPPSEIQRLLDKTIRVKNKNGTDVTETYLQGAQIALTLAKRHEIKIAILKDGSPSCGSQQIYDGSFTGKKISGKGMTAALLELNGIKAFSENRIEEAVKYLETMEGRNDAV